MNFDVLNSTAKVAQCINNIIKPSFHDSDFAKSDGNKNAPRYSSLHAPLPLDRQPLIIST